MSICIRAFAAASLGLLLSAAAVAQTVPTSFVNETLITGLDEPAGMAVLPDGRLLIVERRTAKVRMVVNGHLAATDPVLTVANVTSSAWDERGLQGVAVDPRWPSYPYLYVSFTRTNSRISVVRYTASGDLSNAAGENLTFSSPLVLMNDLRDVASNHNGLGLRFGTDGKLLMTLGDDTDHCAAQRPDSLKGKLLRLDVSRLPAGSGGPVPKALLIPSDNPLSGGDSSRRLVYAYGLRNPWRFHVDTSTGAILVADVGEATYEELNEVFAGDNLGWPYREGTLSYTRSECGTGSGAYDPPIHTLPRSSGFSCIATAGVYRPSPTGTANWPTAYWGNLFFVDFYSGQLRRLVRSGGSWSPASSVPGQPTASDWATSVRHATDFAVGRDGSLYWIRLTNNSGSAVSGMLSRIRYTGTPVAVDAAALQPTALSAWPNPFRERIELAWRLTESAPVAIEIFDLAGRHVRSLRDDTGGIEGRMTWDGKDHRGAVAPSGVYLARLAGVAAGRPVRILKVD